MADQDRPGHIGVGDAEAFRELGHQLVDRIADFYASLPERPIRTPSTLNSVRDLLGQGPLPDAGTDSVELLATTADLLFDHSLHNGHPRFYGYITASAAPIGALADMLAASVNANLGLWDLAPVAIEIETQTVRWLAEFVGYNSDCGGLMVSGGNVANMLGFLAARRARTGPEIRSAGVPADDRLTIYCAAETHTWIQKAADVSGIGTDAIRWIDTDAEQRMDVAALREQIAMDVTDGRHPFIVIATAGTVSTGAIDPLPEIHAVAREYDLWFHVDGAYGAPAAVLPEAPGDLKALTLADSIALDPHKWLYAPLEAACTLVRDPQHLLDAFSYRPPYYRIAEGDSEWGNNYFEWGLQNSRGFRALKVWLALRSCGRDGYVDLIRNDIERAAELYRAAQAHAEMEACTLNLSIATFRFVPAGVETGTAEVDAYLNDLNAALVEELQNGGRVYVSNAVIDGKYVLRACIVNFRTTAEDTAASAQIIVADGRKLDGKMRPAALRD